MDELTKELQRVSKLAEIAKPSFSPFGSAKVIEKYCLLDAFPST